MIITKTRLGMLALALALALPATANAHGYKAGDLEIGHPWSRQTPDGAKVGVGYIKSIRNNGTTPDRLVAVEAAIASKVEIHESREVDGVARMRPVEAIDIPAGGEVSLAPSGYHMMLTGLKEPLSEGENIPATLVFERAGRVEVELQVEAMGATPKAHSHH